MGTLVAIDDGFIIFKSATLGIMKVNYESGNAYVNQTNLYFTTLDCTGTTYVPSVWALTSLSQMLTTTADSDAFNNPTAMRGYRVSGPLATITVNSFQGNGFGNVCLTDSNIVPSTGAYAPVTFEGMHRKTLPVPFTIQ
jgi:hypothetical protein